LQESTSLSVKSFFITFFKFFRFVTENHPSHIHEILFDCQQSVNSAAGNYYKFKELLRVPIVPRTDVNISKVIKDYNNKGSVKEFKILNIVKKIIF
jgi:hypothetical protein